ncbi:MAG: LCP family protein [Ruminococcus sp.]|nr:LCP family protein [Ruminococcus sp.]
MSKTHNNDFEFTKSKTLHTSSTPAQEELDSIEYVLPVSKKKKKHKVKHHSIPDINQEAENIEYIYAKPHSKRKKRRNKIKKVLITITCIILGFVIATAGTIFVFNEIGKSAMHDYKDMEIEPAPEIENIEDVQNSGKTITYNGSTYAFNDKVMTVVLMGIDDFKSDNPEEVIGTAGQADAIYIAVINTLDNKVSLLGVSRDTMADVSVYNIDGEFVKNSNMQICLSYAYGDGKHSSCENTISSLERLFYGMQFNTYFSFNKEAVSTLTDTIGGVTLTSDIDFDSKYYGRTIQKGETFTLHGDDANQYIRARDIDELDSNNDRMARQKQFMTAFFSQIWGSVKSNPALVVDLYNTVDDYSTTNLTTAKMTYLATTAISGLNSYQDIEFINVPGTIQKGEYAELIVDQNALMEIILDLFYVKVK